MSTFPTEITSDLGNSIGSFLVYLLTTLIHPSTTEITSAGGTLSGSILVYWIITSLQQRTKKNNTLRLIGAVYAPLRYFIKVRHIGVVTNVLFLIFWFSLFLSLLIGYFFRSTSGYIVNIIFFIAFISSIFLIPVLLLFWDKRDQTIRELIDEISAYSTVDKGSLTLRWRTLYWGTLVLAERCFLFVFIAVVLTTSFLSLLNNGFRVLGAELIKVFTISFFLSFGLVRGVRRKVLGSNTKRLKVSLFDTSDEIESKLFNLIKEPSLCLCIVDDKENKHCGSLEGITYSVLIRDKGGILVSIPYDHVYRVEECKAKDDTVGSTLQPYL